MKPHLAWSLALVATAGASAWLGATLAEDRPPSSGIERTATGEPPGATGKEALAELAIEIGALRRDLERERTEREALSREVQQLAKAPTRSTDTAASSEERSASDEPLSVEEQAERERAILVGAGFDERTVAEYRERMDAIELERLYLRDRADRENWRRSDRYREEMQDIDGRARDLGLGAGEDFVDWTLYARGEPNRLAVGHVMAGSAAAEAGLRPGDLVVRYGDAALRNPWELARQTRSGRAEEPVEVVVERNGERFTVTVPRGPLGVRTEGRSIEPLR